MVDFRLRAHGLVLLLILKPCSYQFSMGRDLGSGLRSGGVVQSKIGNRQSAILEFP